MVFNSCGRMYVPQEISLNPRSIRCGYFEESYPYVTLCPTCDNRARSQYPSGWNYFPGDCCSHGVRTGFADLADVQYIIDRGGPDLRRAESGGTVSTRARFCSSCAHDEGWALLTEEQQAGVRCLNCDCVARLDGRGVVVECGPDCLCEDGYCEHCAHGERECGSCSCRCSGCDCMSRECQTCDCGFNPCEECNHRCEDGCTCDDAEFGCSGCGCNVPVNDEGANDYSPLVRSYSTRAEQLLTFMGDPIDNVWFGVELETNVRSGFHYGNLSKATQEALGRDFVILKHDGSIGRGFEIVTAPATLDVHRERWTAFLEQHADRDNQTFRGIDSWDSEQCGMHVHVSKPGDWHVAKMRRFLNDPLNMSQITNLAGRNSSDYARFNTEHAHNMKGAIQYRACLPRDGCGAWQLSTDGKEHVYIKGGCSRGGRHSGGTFNGSRYESLNITNPNTVEIRIFRGTLDPAGFFKNLEFVHALYYYTKDESPVKMTWANFSAWVRANPSDYPALINWLESPVRARPISAARARARLAKRQAASGTKNPTASTETAEHVQRRVTVYNTNSWRGLDGQAQKSGFLVVSPPLPPPNHTYIRKRALSSQEIEQARLYQEALKRDRERRQRIHEREQAELLRVDEERRRRIAAREAEAATLRAQVAARRSAAVATTEASNASSLRVETTDAAMRQALSPEAYATWRSTQRRRHSFGVD